MPDLNWRLLPCEGSTLATELIARMTTRLNSLSSINIQQNGLLSTPNYPRSRQLHGYPGNEPRICGSNPFDKVMHGKVLVLSIPANRQPVLFPSDPCHGFVDIGEGLELDVGGPGPKDLRCPVDGGHHSVGVGVADVGRPLSSP